MEYVVLYKVGLIMNAIVKTGYTIVGVYIVGTGYRYYKDYKHFSKQDKLGDG